ncbi:type IV secretion system protein VirB9 [Rhizobiales bacterium GAS113]|nr:type IV secretion system protein VirB9 [Rhizobiales bacterium GAS113]
MRTKMAAAALTAALLWCGVSRPGFAEEEPRPAKGDNRIRKVTFQQDNVVPVAGVMGVSTMIVFGEDERIATLALGDSLSWQAVPDQSKRFLFIKPLEREAVTNMTVVTSRRIYNFILKGAPAGSQNQTYKLVFSYPDDDSDKRLLDKAKTMAALPNWSALIARPGVNLEYGYKGSEVLKPEAVFDDGVKTYFKFSGSGTTPAIFQVLPDRSESLVNYRREGDALVVDKIAAQWTLRRGDEATCVFNLTAVPAPERKNVMGRLGEPTMLTSKETVNGGY